MKIVTEIKYNKEYFYLKHSFRNFEGKVITKSKYLGEEVPNNIEKIKSNFYNDINKELFGKLDLIKENFQDNWNKIPNSIKEKELEEISIAFTYNTNAIEGSTITLSETREILQSNLAPKKSLNEIFETKNHSKVFLNSLKESKKITQDLLLEWHLEIFKDSNSQIAGKFRDYQVRVGNYYPVEFMEIHNLLKQLEVYIKNSKIHIVELAGRVHYLFEKIHPFGDGNGRVGRILMNYILWHSGYPMIIVGYDERKSYYSAFEKDETGFVQYFMKYYLKTHKKRYLK